MSPLSLSTVQYLSEYTDCRTLFTTTMWLVHLTSRLLFNMQPPVKQNSSNDAKSVKPSVNMHTLLQCALNDPDYMNLLRLNTATIDGIWFGDHQK